MLPPGRPFPSVSVPPPTPPSIRQQISVVFKRDLTGAVSLPAVASSSVSFGQFSTILLPRGRPNHPRLTTTLKHYSTKQIFVALSQAIKSEYEKRVVFLLSSYWPLPGIWRIEAVAGRRAESGGRRTEGGGRRTEDGGRRAEGGGRRAEGGGRRAEGGGRWAVGGGRRAVGGGRWTEGGGRWAEGDRQRAVGGGRRTVDGGRWTVDGGRTAGERWAVGGGQRAVGGGRRVAGGEHRRASFSARAVCRRSWRER